MLSFPNQLSSRKGMINNKVQFASIRGTNKVDVEEDSILEPSINLEIKESFERQVTKQKSWKGSPLIVLYYVSKFKRQLKNSASQIKFRFITERILNFIHDQASDSKQLFKQEEGKWYDYFKFIHDHLPVIEPDSLPKLIWDIVVLLAVLLSLFYVPIYLSFDIQVDIGGSIIFDILPAYFLLFDVFINCLTAYYSKGVIHRNNIFKHYAKTNLIADLIIVIPALLSSFGITYIRFLLMLRVFRVQRMIESIEEIVNLKEKYANIFQLIKLGFFVLLVCHFCACIWAYIGEYELQQGYNSWIIQYNLDGSDWKSIYITSLYFSVITTLTIGYGDITPQTDIERVYVVVVALLVCGVLAYSISTIGSIFKSMAEKKELFKTKMKVLVRYMRARKLSPHIQLQVKKFYEHFANQESESNIQAEEMMTQLTKNLKEKIAIDIYYQTLKKSRLLSNMCDQCLKQLCLQVKEAKCVPEDILFTRNEQVSKLVFVLKGELCLIANDQIISSYKTGVVGEREFIIQGSFPTQLQASHFCQIAYLNYEDFINVIKDHNEDHQKFSMIRDNLIFNESYQNFGQVCEVCHWTHQMIKYLQHIKQRCPYVFVNINKNKVLRQSKQSFDQSRLSFERSLRKQLSLAQKSDLQECALALIINENLINSEELNDQLLQELGFSVEGQLNRSSTLTHQGSSVIVYAVNEKETKRTFSNKTNKSQSLQTVDLFFRNSSLSDQQAIQQTHDKSQFYKRSIIHSPDKMRSSSGESIVSSSISQKRKVQFQNIVDNPIQQIRQNNNSSTVNVKGDQNSFLQNYYAKMESQKSVQMTPLNQARHSTLLSNASQAQQQRWPDFKRMGQKKFSKKPEQQTDITDVTDMVHEIEQELQQNSHNIIESLDIDRQFMYTLYYPPNNLDNIIYKMKQLQGSIIPQSNFISGFKRSKTQRLKS